MPNLENAPDPVPFETVVTSTGAEHELTRENTTIFQYLGKLAIYDHIFITPENSLRPLYIWRFRPADGQPEEAYEDVKKKAQEHKCQNLENLSEIGDNDIEVYVLHAKDGMGDTVPDWEVDE